MGRVRVGSKSQTYGLCHLRNEIDDKLNVVMICRTCMEHPVNLGLTFRYKEGYSGILVGQCVELPSLIVQGNSYDELKAKMLKVLTEYFKRFPEEKRIILTKHGKVVDTKSWTNEQLVCMVD